MFTGTSGGQSSNGGDGRSSGFGGTGGGGQAGGGFLIILLIIALVFVMSSSSAMVFSKKSATSSTEVEAVETSRRDRQLSPTQPPSQPAPASKPEPRPPPSKPEARPPVPQPEPRPEPQPPATQPEPSSAPVENKPSSKPTKKNELLTSVFSSAMMAIKIYLRRGLKVIGSIPREGRTAEEQTFEMAYAAVLDRGYRVDGGQLDSLLATLLDKDQWTLLSYLVTALSSRQDHLNAFADAWIRRQQQQANSGTHRRIHRYLMIDLLFVSIMVANPLVESGLQTRNILVHGRRYNNIDGDKPLLRGQQALTVMRNMMTDYRNLLLLEAQNTLGHRRAEIGANRYCRYWQLQAIHYRHSHSFLDVFVGYLSYFDKLALELALGTLNTKRRRDFEQYHLISVQTLMTMLAKSPQNFYDSSSNVYAFVNRLRTFLNERLLQPYNDISLRLPLVVYVMDTALEDDMSPVYSVDSIAPKHCKNTNVVHQPPHVNHASKCLVTYDRRFRRTYTINRPYAPLPNDSDPFDYTCGSLYLGVGHGARVDRFQNLDYFAFVEKTKKNPISYWVSSYVNERVAFEGYKNDSTTVPKLRLKGVSVLSGRTGRLVNHLLLQTIDTELVDALNDHKGWQASLIDRYLHDEEPLSFATYTERLRASKEKESSSPRLDTKRLALARKLLEFGVHLYASVLNRLKTELMVLLRRERNNRARMRKMQLNDNDTTQGDDDSDDDDDDDDEGQKNSAEWASKIKRVLPDYELLEFNGKLMPTDINLDHDSTRYEGWLTNGNVVEEPPDRVEQWLWDLIGIKSELSAEQMKKFTPETSFARFVLPLPDVGPVLRTRLVSSMLFTFNALVIQDKPTLFADHLKRYLAKQTKAAMSQTLNEWLLPNRSLGDRRAAFIDEQLISGKTCQLPMCLVLNQQSFDAKHQEDAGKLAIVTLQIEIGDETILRKVLVPMRVPPSELAASNSLADLEHDFQTQYDAAMFDCLAHPRIREAAAGQVVTIYVWMQRPTDNQAAPQEFINSNTIRMQNDEVGEFKIFNVLWRNVQYLLVRQGNRIKCGAPQNTTNITGVSKLWYGSFNADYEESVHAAVASAAVKKSQDACNDIDVNDYKAAKTIQLNDEGYFYVEAEAVATTTATTEREHTELPALRLQTDSTVNVLQVLSDKTRYTRKGVVRRVQPDSVRDLLPKLNENV